MGTLKPELWMTVKGRDDYMVSNTGKVKSYHRQWRRWVDKSNREDSKGYLTVGISSGTKSTSSARVHRLVAEAFIPNPTNLPYVNHKDSNPKNNDVSNLEWCDAKYNSQHSFFSGSRVSGYAIPVKLFIDDEFFSYYSSVEHCIRQFTTNKKFFNLSEGIKEQLDGMLRIEEASSVENKVPLNRKVLKKPIRRLSSKALLYGDTPYNSITDFANEKGLTYPQARWACRGRKEYLGIPIKEISISEYIRMSDLIEWK